MEMDDKQYTLVNFLSFNYIPIELREKCYNSLKRDIYYYYHGTKINENDKIECINGNNWDLHKDNLRLIPEAVPEHARLMKILSNDI